MGGGIEQQTGITVERMEYGTLLEEKGAIRHLRFNVLAAENGNIHTKITPIARGRELKPISKEFRSSAEHEAAFAAYDRNGEVVGFLYIELDPHGRRATIKEMWSSVPEGSQAEIITKLLDAAKGELPDERYPRLDVEAAVQAKHFRRLAANPRYKFLRIHDAEPLPSAANEPSASLEKAA